MHVCAGECQEMPSLLYCLVVEAAGAKARSSLFKSVLVPTFSSRHLFRISSIWREEIGNRNRLVARRTHTRARRKAANFFQSLHAELGAGCARTQRLTRSYRRRRRRRRRQPRSTFFGGSIRQQRLSSIRRPSTIDAVLWVWNGKRPS